MSAYRHVVYSSLARESIQPAEIDALLCGARAFNERSGVTGILLFAGSHFFQLFEGPHLSVDEVYARIRCSPLHSQINEIASDSSPRRAFDRWYMGFCHAPQSFIQQLEDLTWQQTLYARRTDAQPSPALAHLDAFLAASGDRQRHAQALMVA